MQEGQLSDSTWVLWLYISVVIMLHDVDMGESTWNAHSLWEFAT